MACCNLPNGGFEKGNFGPSDRSLARPVKKTAWFLCHRIRESLRDTTLEPIGGEGKTVEFDEVFVGGKERNKHRNKRNKRNIGGAGKEAVFPLVERGGRVRSHHVSDVSARTLRPILQTQIKEATKTMSDDGGARVRHGHPQHQSVNHSIGECVRGDARTNTIEGYFSTNVGSQEPITALANTT